MQQSPWMDTTMLKPASYGQDNASTVSMISITNHWCSKQKKSGIFARMHHNNHYNHQDFIIIIYKTRAEQASLFTCLYRYCQLFSRSYQSVRKSSTMWWYMSGFGKEPTSITVSGSNEYIHIHKTIKSWKRC